MISQELKENIHLIINRIFINPIGGICLILFEIFFLIRTLKKKDEIQDIWSPIQPYMSAIAGSIGFIIAGIIILIDWIKNV